MFILRSFLAVSLSLAITAAALAAPNFNRRQRHNNSIEGTVVQVHHNRLHRNTGWIKIRHGYPRSYGRRRGMSASASASRRYGSRRGGYTTTLAVNSSTSFQRLGVRGRRSSRLGFGSIHNGERVRIYLGGAQGAARVVDILPNSYNRRRHYYANRNGNYGSYYGRNRNGGQYYGRNGNYGSYYGRSYGYNRNPLYGSRVLVRTSRQQPIVVNRSFAMNRPIVVRSVRNPLIQGRVAARQNRQVVAVPVANRKTTQKIVNKPTVPKQTVAHKPTPTTHKTTYKPASHGGHSAGQPHSSSHRKK